MTDAAIGPIKADMESYDGDVKTAERVLFDIRSGGEVEIMHDPKTGWEMSGEGLSCFMPLDTGERVVNMVLSCSIPEHCIDARRLPLFIARSALHSSHSSTTARR